MPCTVIDGAIVCTGRRRQPKCSSCKLKPGIFLCDWKTPGWKDGTCSKPICGDCTTKPAPDKDLCPVHAKDWKAWLNTQPKTGA